MLFGSLFAGIGGFDLGFERAGMRCAWQVEIDDDALCVLTQHWPDVPKYRDVRTIRNLPPVDLICGGFPCQDLSPANNMKGEGLDGKKSGLWREYLKIVEELRPRWVVVENTGRGWRKWVPFVRRDLYELGYTSVPLLLRASDFGALHERSRCFVVAAAESRHKKTWSAREAVAAIAHSIRAAPHAYDKRELQEGRREPEGWQRPADCPWWAVEPDLARVVHGLSGGLDTTRRVRVLGNAVCPPIVEWLGREIIAHDDPASGRQMSAVPDFRQR